MVKAIIFDFDGTLANTLPVCDASFQHVFQSFDQRSIASKEIRSMFGPSETGIIRQNLAHDDKEQAIELYYETYLGRHAELVENDKEIHSLLFHLKERGIKLGIVTGKAKRSLDISMKALNMENLFDAIVTGDDVAKPKPDPEGIHKGLELLHVSSGEALFVGDSDADIGAGKQANVFTVGVNWLPDYQTATFSVQPDVMFKAVTEFLELMERGVSDER
jgi:phosphoglycolate phosphatase/pyrophosphatase PpaX